MTSEITIRSCRDEDIPRVLDLWKDAGVVPRPTDNAGALEIRLRRDAELFVLATDGERIVGSLMGGWDGWRGNMGRLAVLPAYRRRGIALRLVREVERRLREIGCARITSLVFVDEPGASELWSSAGYAPDPAVQRYFKDI